MINPKDVVELYDKLDSEKGTLKSHLQEIADYMVPSAQGLFASLTPGGKRMSKIYDGTAIRALRVFANGLYGNLTPLSTPWFALNVKNKTVAEMATVAYWLADTTERMRNAINASNAPLALHEVYTSEGWAGTGLLFISEGNRYSLNCETFPIATACITEDAEGIVDGVYRLIKYTARQCVQQWGSACSEEVHKAYKGMQMDKQFDIIHAVFPRNDRDWRKMNKENMPFASVYIEKQTTTLLSEGGFQEFPYAVPRWEKTTGEDFGRSPAMDALPDVKMLNQMSYDNMRGVQKMIDPPLLASKESSLSSTNTKPGGVIYHKSGEVPSTLQSNGRFDIALEVEEQRRKAIKEAFYNDLFQLLAQDQTNDRTAYEISKRLEENLAILGPALGRQQTELFDPFLSRVFSILLRAGQLLPIPPELAGQGLSIDYVGRLALAMKSQETNAAGQTLAFMGQFVQVKPEILDNYDFDEMAQGTAQRTGMPVKYLMPPDKRDAIRAARQEAEEKAAQAVQMEALMNQLPNMGKAIEPNSALDKLGKMAAANQ